MCDSSPLLPNGSAAKGHSVTDVEAMQARWTETRDRDTRRQMGQFFTPRWIARSMARWTLDAHPRQIVDPAFGFGMLADECLRQGFKGQLTAYEIDSDLVEAWRTGTAGQRTVDLTQGDFLSLAPAQIDAAIANPPYNRFQNRDLTPAVQQQLHTLLGELASGFTNQYALFIYLVVSRLAAHGRAAFIVPSEFLATGYGVQVKNFLLQSRRLQHLVLFDTAERVFPEAATTACVLLFGHAAQTDLSVWHLAGSSDEARLAALCAGHPSATPDAVMPYSALDPTANWQGLGLGGGDLDGLVPLLEFGRTKRGIATGANEFFLLTQAEAAQRLLDERSLIPCVASADSATQPVFDDADWRALRDSGRTAYLFNGMATGLDEIGHPASYIAYGEQQEYHLRYLTKMRRPWYRLEQRPVAPLLLAVFGRGGFRAVLNRSSAVNLTAFHAFYPTQGKQYAVGLLWLYLQTPLARHAFERQHRAYGDGLKKLEPGDWNKLLVPDWRLWPQQALEQAQGLVQAAVAAERAHDDQAWADTVHAFAMLVDQCRVNPLKTQAPPAATLPRQYLLV